MRSSKPGGVDSSARLGEVGIYDFSIHVDGRFLRLTYYDFPWFRDATLEQLAAIERPAPDRLRWPELDVDLSIESIENPKRYPQVSGYPERG